MKIRDLLEQVDRFKPNKFTDAEKFKWLSEIDGMIKKELLDTHEDSIYPNDFLEYIEEVDDDTELIAPKPYDAFYRWLLESQIDLANGEIAKYNNSRAMYNSAYTTFTDWYNRTHLPRRVSMRFTENRRLTSDALST